MKKSFIFVVGMCLISSAAMAQYKPDIEVVSAASSSAILVSDRSVEISAENFLKKNCDYPNADIGVTLKSIKEEQRRYDQMYHDTYYVATYETRSVHSGASNPIGLVLHGQKNYDRSQIDWTVATDVRGLCR